MQLSKDLAGRNYIVLGAMGSIGGAVYEELISRGAKVMAVLSGEPQLDAFIDRYGGNDSFAAMIDSSDFEKEYDTLGDFFFGPHFDPSMHGFQVDGIVCSIGHCPAGCFDLEVSIPLSDFLDIESDDFMGNDFDDNIERLIKIPAMWIAQAGKRFLKKQAHFLIIGSAINRFNASELPPPIFAGHYAIVQAAQEKMVEWFQGHDPISSDNGIFVSRIGFGAIDTPFHKGCKLNPPKMLSMRAVVREIISALQSPTPVMKEVTA